MFGRLGHVVIGYGRERAIPESRMMKEEIYSMPACPTISGSLNSERKDDHAPESCLSEKLLTVKLYCGLGNQLFQLASGLGTALKLKRLFVVQPGNIFHSHQHSTDEAVRRIVRSRFILWNRKETSTCRIVQLHSKQYIDIPDCAEKLILMDGYWQNVGYFSSDLDFVAEQFASLAADTQETERIGLHLRLGDYCKLRNRFHLVTPDYIRRAVSFQLKRGASRRVDVFTDRDSVEMACCLVDRALHGMGMDIQVVRDGSDLDDFVRLTAYDHLVGAPSTFSWWASFLHRYVSDRHTVCFPKQLYNPSCHLSGNEEGFYRAATKGELLIIDDQ